MLRKKQISLTATLLGLGHIPKADLIPISRNAEVNSNADINISKPIKDLDIIFNGMDIRNLKYFNFENREYFGKPYGGNFASFLDYFLRESDLVIKEVPPLEKIYATVSSGGILHPDKNVNLIGYMRECFDSKIATQEEKKAFIEKNIEKLITAGMLGFNNRAIANSIVNIRGKITAVGCEGFQAPTISLDYKKSYNSATDFTIHIDDETKKMAIKIYNSPRFKKLQTQLMDMISNDYGEQSKLHKLFEKNYKNMEAFLNGSAQKYDGEHFVFQGVNNITAHKKNGVLRIEASLDIFDMFYRGGINPSLQNLYPLKEGRIVNGVYFESSAVKENPPLLIQVTTRKKDALPME